MLDQVEQRDQDGDLDEAGGGERLIATPIEALTGVDVAHRESNDAVVRAGEGIQGSTERGGIGALRRRGAGDLPVCARGQQEQQRQRRETTARATGMITARGGVAGDSSGVREFVGLAALDELPLTRCLVVDRQHLDRLAGVCVERLAAAFLDDDLVTVLEPQHDDGMLTVDVLFPELLGSGRHGNGV